MDSVFKKYIETFSFQSKENNHEIVSFSDFFKELSIFSDYKNISISVTYLNNENFFISNNHTKGFFLERDISIDKLENINTEYKKIQKSIGKITNLFGFENRYLENITELLSNDADSFGLGVFTEEFNNRIRNNEQKNKIDINTLFTIGYEGNGNRLILDKNNNLYIYGHDLISSNYDTLEDFPPNTFYSIPNIKNLTDLISMFFDDFVK